MGKAQRRKQERAAEPRPGAAAGARRPQRRGVGPRRRPARAAAARSRRAGALRQQLLGALPVRRLLRDQPQPDGEGHRAAARLSHPGARHSGLHARPQLPARRLRSVGVPSPQRPGASGQRPARLRAGAAHAAPTGPARALRPRRRGARYPGRAGFRGPSAPGHGGELHRAACREHRGILLPGHAAALLAGVDGRHPRAAHRPLWRRRAERAAGSGEQGDRRHCPAGGIGLPPVLSPARRRRHARRPHRVRCPAPAAARVRARAGLAVSVSRPRGRRARCAACLVVHSDRRVPARRPHRVAVPADPVRRHPLVPASVRPAHPPDLRLWLAVRRLAVARRRAAAAHRVARPGGGRRLGLSPLCARQFLSGLAVHHAGADLEHHPAR